MKKQDCLEHANKARAAAKAARASAVLYASTFGGADKLTQDAFLRADVADEVARKWENLAEWNPKTRAAAFRKGDIPAYMFGY